MRGVVIALFAFSGCAPLPQDGAVLCGPDPTHACPEGFDCIAGACYRHGHHPAEMTDMGASESADMTVAENGDMASAAPDDMAGERAADMTPMPSDLSGPFTWTKANVTGNFFGVWERSPSDVWVVGAGGLIMHSNGDGTWSAPITGIPAQDLHTIWGDPVTGDIWVGGASNTLLHTSDGVHWSQETLSQQLGAVLSIWGTDHNNIWASGNGATGLLVHSTGNGVWGTAAGLQPNAGNHYFLGIGGSGPTEIFAVGGNEIYKFNGTGWFKDYTDSNTNTVFQSVTAVSATSIYATAGTGMFYSVGNGQWTNQTASTSWGSVWGSSASDIYATGGGAYPGLAHSIGNGSWSQESLSGQCYGRAIFGTSKDDIYVVGSNNYILHGHR